MRTISTKNPRAAIEAVNQQVSAAMAKRDAAALAEFYTADGMVLAQNFEMVKGKEAIKNFFQGFIDSGATGLTLTAIEVESFGETANEVGQYFLKMSDGTEVDRGKYLVVWKRVKGQWKLHRDIFNTSLPPAK